MQQGSKEWLEFRRDKIGASDAPVIMGASKWTSKRQLWENKILGKEVPSNPAMERGTLLEPVARQRFIELVGVEVFPEVLVHKQRPWQIASMDGLSSCKKIGVEIKCPGSTTHSIAKSGSIPEVYYPQLQHQMEVCELDYMYYFSFDGTEGVILKVQRDDPYIKVLIEEETEFKECLESLIAPAMTSKDYSIIYDPDLCALSKEWEKNNEILKAAKKKDEELREKLVQKVGGNAIVGGIKISRSFRKGAIEYDKIEELKNVNLEIYRKKAVESWRFSDKF